MLKINVETIPHDKQRYETVGDWWFDGDTLEVRVSDMGNRRYEFLVAVHEIDEAFLCRERGISEASVSGFDVDFERERAMGLRTATEEPGDSREAPYYKEHQFATKMEKLRSKQLGVNWQKYSDAVNDL